MMPPYDGVDFPGLLINHKKFHCGECEKPLAPTDPEYCSIQLHMHFLDFRISELAVVRTANYGSMWQGVSGSGIVAHPGIVTLGRHGQDLVVANWERHYLPIQGVPSCIVYGLVSPRNPLWAQYNTCDHYDDVIDCAVRKFDYTGDICWWWNRIFSYPCQTWLFQGYGDRHKVNIWSQGYAGTMSQKTVTTNVVIVDDFAGMIAQTVPHA